MITIKRKLYENNIKEIVLHFHVEGCEPNFLKAIFEENRNNILSFGEVYAEFIPENVFKVVIYKYSLDHDLWSAEYLKKQIKRVTGEVMKIKKILVEHERATDISDWVYKEYKIKTFKEQKQQEEPIKFVPEKIVFPEFGNLDWDGVPENSKVMVWDNRNEERRYFRHFSRCKPCVFASGKHEQIRKDYAVPVDYLSVGDVVAPNQNWSGVRIDTPLLVWDENNKRTRHGRFAKCDIVDTYGSIWDNAVLIDDSRFNVNWEEIPVDTKILAVVEHGGFFNWRNGFLPHYSHFAKYEDGKVYAFKDGKTSDCASSVDDVFECTFAMLASSEY